MRRRLLYSYGSCALLALSLTACSLNVPATPPNGLIWSAGVVYTRCVEQTTTTYYGEVQRVVVLGKTYQLDADSFKVVEPKGRCETSGVR